MKNKFVTAVTTAGLLAGILGSAFVPSVKAADDDAVLTMAYAAADASDTTYAYFSTAAYPVFTVSINPGDATDDNGVYGVNVSGGTIRSCTATADGTSTVTGIVITSAACTGTVTFDDAADGAVFTVTLNKLAAGAIATVTADDDDTTGITMTGARKLKGQASTALAAKLNVAKTVATIKWDADSGNAADTTDLSDVSISGVPYFATSGAFGSVAEFRGELRNGYNTAMATDTVVIAEVTGSNYINCDEAVAGSITAGTVALATFTIADGSDYECSVTAADGAEGTGGAWTATLKTAAGEVIGTVKGGFLGAIASATVTAAASRVASDLGADGDDFFTVSLKDAAGRAYGAADVQDTSSGIDLLAWDAADAVETDITDTDDTAGTTNGKFKLDKEICDNGAAPDADGVENSRKVQFSFLDGAGDDVLSNTLTLVCGVDVDSDLEVRSIAMASASVVPGGTVDAWIYLQDADGNLAGYGDKLGADLELALSGGTNADLDAADSALENADYTTKVGGYIVVTLKAPATAGSVVTLSDPASAAIAKSIVQSDSFDNTIAASGRKVTANFGPAAAKKKVTFVVEFASGTVRSYVRKANASGVAVFSSPFGKVYITASFGDEISDTVYIKK
jgi:hypothetical protein